jgi:hypothetical protein
MIKRLKITQFYVYLDKSSSVCKLYGHLLARKLQYECFLFVLRKLCSTLSVKGDDKLEPMPDLNSLEMKFGEMSLASR